MTKVSRRFVVDTGVLLTANKRAEVSLECVHECGKALNHIMVNGHIFLDTGWRIIKEYGNKLVPNGDDPGVGNEFLEWVLTNRSNPNRCTCVPITPSADDRYNFDEFPTHHELRNFDPSDRKFVAVSASHGQRHGESPPILHAVDSKWWGWKDALDDCGIHVEFLCLAETEKKYHEKMNS